MNQYTIFCVQTSTPTSSMQEKLTEHEKCCMQNTQLLTKSHFALKGNSNILRSIPPHGATNGPLPSPF